MRRKTSSLERFMLFFGRQYPLNFGFRVTIDGRFSREKAEAAFRLLADKHALLYGHQEYTDGKQMDMVLDDLPALRINEVRGEESWQEVLLSCMVREFNPFTGPLFSLDWRAIDGGAELLFVFQHGGADGIAAVYFINDFVTLYSGGEIAFPPKRIMPVLYDVMDEALYKELLTRPEPAWKSEPLPPPKAFDMPAYKAPSFYLKTFEMSARATAKLAAEAKAIGETVHSYLGALIMRESFGLFADVEGHGSKAGEDGKQSMRTIQCPVDFRQYLKEEFRSMAGVYNGIVKVSYDCNLPIAEAAKKIREGIIAYRKDAKDIEEYFHFRDSFDNVPDPESFMMGFPPDPLDYDFSFSNLGRTVIAEDYNGLKVGGLYGPIFTAVNGETVIGLNTTNGQLRMSLIFDRAIPEERRYRELGDRIAAVFARFE